MEQFITQPITLIMYAINVLVLWTGAWVGLTAADIDLAPPLPISHRSAWTHGPVFPFALSLATITVGHPLLTWFALGFLPSFALHLAYDMFPRRWVSISKISLMPIPIRLPGWMSFIYLWFSAVIAIACTLLVITQTAQLVWAGAALLFYGFKYVQKESGTWPWPFSLFFPGAAGDFPPLLMFGGATVAGLALILVIGA